MSAPPVRHGIVPRDQWAEVIAEHVAARPDPTPPKASPGCKRALSPLEPCEVCGRHGIFALCDDGTIDFFEIHALRVDSASAPGQKNWLWTKNTQHRCAGRSTS